MLVARENLEWAVKGRKRALEELQEIDAKKTVADVDAVNDRRRWARVQLVVFVMVVAFVGLALGIFLDGMATVGLVLAATVTLGAVAYVGLGGLATMRPEDMKAGFRALMPFEVQALVEKAQRYAPAAAVVRGWVESNRELREQEQWAVNAYALAQEELDRFDAALAQARNA